MGVVLRETPRRLRVCTPSAWLTPTPERPSLLRSTLEQVLGNRQESIGTQEEGLTRLVGAGAAIGVRCGGLLEAEAAGLGRTPRAAEREGLSATRGRRRR